jgi:hypothetical protein
VTTVRRVDAGETETHRKSQRRMCDQIVMELGDIMRIRAQKAFVLAWNPGLPIRSCLAPWMQPGARCRWRSVQAALEAGRDEMLQMATELRASHTICL